VSRLAKSACSLPRGHRDANDGSLLSQAQLLSFEVWRKMQSGTQKSSKDRVEISVVIPLYNRADEIARALDSVRAQTVSPIEVIVVDDGSTDSGAEVVRRYEMPGLKLIRQGNTGQHGARNRGIREAKGELVAFLDADDTWEPEFLEAIAEMRRRYPRCGVYGTAWRIRSKAGKCIVPPFRGVPPKGKHGVLKSYFATASKGMCICASATAVPRHVLEKVGGFPVETRGGLDVGVVRGGDRAMWLSIAVEYPVAFANTVLATWHHDVSNRATDRYKHGLDHLVIRTGLSLLAREDLPPGTRRDLASYVGRTQIFLAKQLIRGCRPKEARRLLWECVAPARHWWRWLACMAGTFVPKGLFVAAYRMKCEVGTWFLREPEQHR